VILPAAALEGIAAGEITVAFRRWKRPSVRAGGTLTTRVGVLAIDAVEPVDDVDEEGARRAGFPDAAAAPEELAELRRRLARLDRSNPRGPWTDATLRTIAAQPGVRAADLAAEAGVERLRWKADVRKLKALGLTESLEVGYRLSPRGAAYLSAQE